MAQHLCVKTGQIGVLVCNNLEIETSLQQQHENGNKCTQFFGDCPTQQIVLHDKFEEEKTELTATALYVCSFQITPLRWWEGLFWQKKICKGECGAQKQQSSNI